MSRVYSGKRRRASVGYDIPMEIVGVLGPLAVWWLAGYRAWCWVRHEEPRPSLRWPLSLITLAWLGLTAMQARERAYAVPLVLQRLSFGLIPVVYPPEPEPQPEPVPVEAAPAPAPAPEPVAVAPAPKPKPAAKPAPRKRKKKKPAPEPVPDL
jgi:hypothetical protein